MSVFSLWPFHSLHSHYWFACLFLSAKHYILPFMTLIFLSSLWLERRYVNRTQWCHWFVVVSTSQKCRNAIGCSEFDVISANTAIGCSGSSVRVSVGSFIHKVRGSIEMRRKRVMEETISPMALYPTPQHPTPNQTTGIIFYVTSWHSFGLIKCHEACTGSTAHSYNSVAHITTSMT